MGDEGPNGPAGPTACRGIRGATTVAEPDAGEVQAATVELLDRMLSANGCTTGDVAAVIFTLTADLAGVNPAAAARASGWDAVPLLAVREHAGDTGPSDAEPPRCIRVLLLANTARRQAEVHHVYLREAAVLRPDLAPLP